MNSAITLSVSEFVALLNQTFEYAYPNVTITGELANFRVSKNRWVYFDVKDELASVKFFGSVYQLSGPLEDGMMVAVKGVPRLHPQYGFSVTMQTIQPVGEGSIKKAAALLEAKLAAEGLFEPTRKRTLPYPPQKIGLITSAESAAYRDFMKILHARWGGTEVLLLDVQVQGEAAPAQLVAAVEQFNQLPSPPDILVMTRGGGSAEDLAAFNTEHVTRAVAASRIPTLVAIGHEVDVSLAELAADQRASTPSNAAELLVPDKKAVLAQLGTHHKQLEYFARQAMQTAHQNLQAQRQFLHNSAEQIVQRARTELLLQRQLLEAFNPQAALRRGYALVRKDSMVLRSGKKLLTGDNLQIQLADSKVNAEVKQVTMEQSWQKKIIGL